ncbi:MAG: hypothetical protein KDD62_07520 [Bdellovibrionales bacterium]|nr:hypothetical protein [Bdellovibrionales bacterium]
MRSMFLLLGLVLVLSSCEYLQTHQEPKASLDWGVEKDQPFALVVKEELNDGQHLRIVAALSSRVMWDLSKVVAVVTGLRNGSVVQSEAFILSEILREQQGELRAQGTVYQPFSDEVVTFNFKFEDSTDYEIELLWGREAAAYLPAESEAHKNSMAELRELEVQRHRSCKGETCQLQFAISAHLVNTAAFLLTEVVLGVGYVYIPQGQSYNPNTMVPESEEKVVLDGLGLVSGASKALHFALNDAVPERSDGQYYPVVRVLTAR